VTIHPDKFESFEAAAFVQDKKWRRAGIYEP